MYFAKFFFHIQVFDPWLYIFQHVLVDKSVFVRPFSLLGVKALTAKRLLCLKVRIIIKEVLYFGGN